MKCIVQKFGGTSVGTVERINAVADTIVAEKAKGHRVAVVVSAMSGETNKLLALAKHISPNPSKRELDVLLATGEQVTTALLAMALHNRHCLARSFCGWQVPMFTDTAHTKARITDIQVARLNEAFAANYVPIIAGFQGVSNNNITTLGRGGSDTSAVAIAAALKADECHIYTDVEGVYTTDPRLCATARCLEHITFEEMLELASQGSKVLQIRAVEFAGKYRIPLRVLSSFVPSAGTLITYEEDTSMEKPVVTAIASQAAEAKITITGVKHKPGVASKILSPIAEANINVDMIVQNISQQKRTDFTFTVPRDEADQAMAVLQEAQATIGAEAISLDSNIAKVSVVGIGMKSHSGVASTMFAALAKENINIILITTSEIKITVAIEEKYMELAVRTLHDVFELSADSAEG